MFEQMPWLNGNEIKKVVNYNRQCFFDIGLIEESGCVRSSELIGVEQRLTHQLPVELFDLYSIARPQPFDLERSQDIFLFPPDYEEVGWYTVLGDRPHPINLIFDDEYSPITAKDKYEWGDAEVFVFGGTPFFDRLLWVRGHASQPDGSIVLTDHDFMDLPLFFVASSLCEYLSRIAYFGGIELASTPETDEVTPQERLQVAKRFLELNPESNYWKQCI